MAVGKVAYTPKKPTAESVGALKIYCSLSELGLTEATATARDIVTAMADNSMLLHPLSVTATTATLAFPYNYSLLVVTKRNNSYTRFECIGTGSAGLIYYGYYNGGATTKWSGWSTRFLPLTGGTVNGNVNISKENPLIDMINTALTVRTRLQSASNGKTQLINYTDSSNWSGITIDQQAESTKNLLNFVQYLNGVKTTNTIHHAGNKPTGSYTGNGNATARTIDTGGIGNVCVITSTYGVAIVTEYGAIVKTASGTTVTGLKASEVSYKNGVLTIASTSNYVNGSSYTYTYEDK